MHSNTIVTQLALLPRALLPPKKSETQRTLHTFWVHPERLPYFAATSPTAQRYLALFGPLDWSCLPERDLQTRWRFPTVPYRSVVLAELIKLEEGFQTLRTLRRFLEEHPSLIWLLGLPLYPSAKYPSGFNTRQSLPTQRHLTRLLREVPNAALQVLLDASVQLIRCELTAQGIAWGECVSLDTKHIVAWVKENNPKVCLRARFNKAIQPRGDPDCRLGCKRKRNQVSAPSTPTRNPVPAHAVGTGEYYWGYGSGIVVTKIPQRGEFVLAELTQPFDQGDATYFFPLMQQTEVRLGVRPHYGAFDAAFDAWYVYAYFYDETNPTYGFAAIPFVEKGGFQVHARKFSAEGLPLCAAGLAMPLQFSYTDRTTCLVEHARGNMSVPYAFHNPLHNPVPSTIPPPRKKVVAQIQKV